MKKCISLIAALALALAVAGCANDSDSLVSAAAASSVKRNAESAPAAATTGTGIIYNDSSNDINNGYTVVSGAEAFNKKYEYDTEAGVTYYVNWCDGYNSDPNSYFVHYTFTNLPDGLVDCEIYVYDASYNQIERTDDSNPIHFTGTGGKVYIKVVQRNNFIITGKCAFRVYK